MPLNVRLVASAMALLGVGGVSYTFWPSGSLLSRENKDDDELWKSKIENLRVQNLDSDSFFKEVQKQIEEVDTADESNKLEKQNEAIKLFKKVCSEKYQSIESSTGSETNNWSEVRTYCSIETQR